MKPNFNHFLLLGFLIFQSGFAVGQSISVSHPSGRYDLPFYLRLDSSVELRYTLSGNTPSPASPLFPDSLLIGFQYPEDNYCLIPTNEIEYNTKSWRNREFGWRPPVQEVDKLHVVRVRGFANGRAMTALLTLVYQINPESDKLPIVSIVTDSANFFDEEIGIYVPGIYYDEENPSWSGNYCLKGDQWERPASFSYFHPDGSLALSQEVGVRIHGGATRICPQKSLRVYARGSYGKESLEFPFFGQNAPQEFSRILLRSGMSYWFERNTIFQDEYLLKLIGTFYPDLDVQLSRPAQMFLNGENWGMVAVKERIDEYYLAAHYNLPREEILFIEPTVDRIEEFDKILQLCRFEYMGDPANYQQISEWMDVQNYARYILLELFLANLDWPNNNSKAWKSKNAGGQWKWIFYDLDASLGDFKEETIPMLLNSDTPLGIIFKGLIENDEFLALLKNEWYQMRSDLFQLSQMGPLLASFIRDYEPGIEAHIQRWQNPFSISDWENHINEMISFLLERPQVFDQQLKDFFSWPDDDSTQGLFDSQIHWKLYPNPVQNYLTVESDGFFQSNWSVQLLTSRGEIIEERKSKGEIRLQFQMNHLPPGVYIVRLYSNVYQATYRVVKMAR